MQLKSRIELELAVTNTGGTLYGNETSMVPLVIQRGLIVTGVSKYLRI